MHFVAEGPACGCDAHCHVMDEVTASLWSYHSVLLPLEGLEKKLNVQSEEVA
jgi:hypothetical protein